MEREISTTAAVEMWRPIAGYEGLYEVSNLGRVRSLDRFTEYLFNGRTPTRAIRRGRIIKLQKRGKGYMIVRLTKDHKEVACLVHRLVAQAFIPNPDNLPIVNHKDRNTANNIASNLEWCTYLYNNFYDGAMERRAGKRKIVIEQLTKDGHHVAYYKSASDLERISNYRFKEALIHRVISGKYRNVSAYGYKWRHIVNPDESILSNITTEPFEYTQRDSSIEQLSLDGQHVAFHKGLKEAAKAVNGSKSSIFAATKSPQAKFRGYRWRYVNDNT